MLQDLKGECDTAKNNSAACCIICFCCVLVALGVLLFAGCAQDDGTAVSPGQPEPSAQERLDPSGQDKADLLPGLHGPSGDHGLQPGDLAWDDATGTVSVRGEFVGTAWAEGDYVVFNASMPAGEPFEALVALRPGADGQYAATVNGMATRIDVPPALRGRGDGGREASVERGASQLDAWAIIAAIASAYLCFDSLLDCSRMAHSAVNECQTQVQQTLCTACYTGAFDDDPDGYQRCVNACYEGIECCTANGSFSGSLCPPCGGYGPFDFSGCWR